MNLNSILEKLSDIEFSDFFPLNNKASTTKNVLITTAIYLCAELFAGLLIALLGNVFVLGVIVKVVGVIVGIYSVVGMVAALFKYMKYN